MTKLRNCFRRWDQILINSNCNSKEREEDTEGGFEDVEEVAKRRFVWLGGGDAIVVGEHTSPKVDEVDSKAMVNEKHSRVHPPSWCDHSDPVPQPQRRDR